MWESINNVVDLIIPFTVLAMISLGAEQATSFLEILMRKIPRLPNYFEWYIAYIIVVFFGFVFCHEANWSLFDYLDVHFNYDWQGYIFTSLLLSSGSSGVRKVFSMIEAIPSNIGGIKGNKIKTREFENILETKEEIITNSNSNINYDSERYSDNI